MYVFNVERRHSLAANQMRNGYCSGQYKYVCVLIKNPFSRICMLLLYYMFVYVCALQKDIYVRSTILKFTVSKCSNNRIVGLDFLLTALCFVCCLPNLLYVYRVSVCVVSHVNVIYIYTIDVCRCEHI